MKLIKQAKLQCGKTNSVVNIPAEHKKALGLEKGDTLIIETDTARKTITIKRGE